MRNLRAIRSTAVEKALPSDCRLLCADASDTGLIFAATEDAVYRVSIVDETVSECIRFKDEGKNSNCHAIVGLTYIPEQSVVCVCTSAGDLMLYNVSTNEVENVGSVASGFVVSSWSPDGDILILVTGHNTIIFMSRNFEPIQEIPLFTDEFGENKPVTVGWGKKETQFHGSEGKMAAVTQEKSSDSIFAWDDKLPRLDWRGDGQLFAINAISPDSGVRRLRIFSRDGLLQATSEDVTGLEHALAWRPSGSVIATVQRLPNKYQLSFFEKNGLRHGEFALRLKPKEAVVKEVLWSPDSSVLAIWLESLEPDNNPDDVQKKSQLQLWTTGNYHWYLKQSLVIPNGDLIAAVVWDPHESLTCHLVTSTGTYLTFSWIGDVDRSQPGITTDFDVDEATVGIIDGNKVKVTPFSGLVIPPPASAYQLQLSSPVNQLMFPRGHSARQFAAVLADNQVAFFEPAPELIDSTGCTKLAVCGGDGFQSKVPLHILTRICGLNLSWLSEYAKREHGLPLFFHHWLWFSANSILVVFTDHGASVLCELGVAPEVLYSDVIIPRYVLTLEGLVLRMVACADGKSAAIQLTDGALLKYSAESGNVLPWMNSKGDEIKFSQPCTVMQSCLISNQEVIFGLTDRFHLYCNDKEISTNCTSFTLHGEFLLITTLDHKLQSIPLHKVPIGICGESGHSRRLERGSRIVLSVTNDTKVVLQMPRGNLESIHPRALCIAAVGRLLDRRQFIDAFTLMRKHRIDMNLLFDHNPQVFLNNVDNFVEQVNNVSWMNIFLSDLKEEDVTTTMYKASYVGNAREQIGSCDLIQGSKIDTVCTSVREALKRMNSNRFFLCLLTSYVKMTTPSLDIALQLIQELKNSEWSNGRKVSPDDALKYLLYLVDVNQLFNVALGTYDFDLVLMVAQKSQKDPKEYLPFLNTLRKMEPNYQRFTIEKYLKRPLKALEHISKCGKEYFSECLEHIKTNNLFKSALKMFPPNSDQYKVLCALYALSLLDKQLYDEAGMFYQRGGVDELALAAFEKGLNWQLALNTARRLFLTADDLTSLALRLAARLADQQRHSEAAYLLEVYAMDYQGSTEVLIEGHKWEESLEMIYRHARLDLLSTRWRPAVLEYNRSLLSSVEKLHVTFEKHVARLVVVRELRRARSEDVIDGDVDFSDLASDSTSVTNLSHSTWTSGASSRVSAKSSKNRRKQERKKSSLKEGSPYEESALLQALTEIMTTADGMKSDCNTVLRMLVLHNYDDEAEKLQKQLTDLLELLGGSKDAIWPPNSPASTPMMGPDSTANSLAAAVQDLQIRSQPYIQDISLLIPPKLMQDTRWKLDVLN